MENLVKAIVKAIEIEERINVLKSLITGSTVIATDKAVRLFAPNGKVIMSWVCKHEEFYGMMNLVHEEPDVVNSVWSEPTWLNSDYAKHGCLFEVQADCGSIKFTRTFSLDRAGFAGNNIPTIIIDGTTGEVLGANRMAICAEVATGLLLLRFAQEWQSKCN